ncbi:MAG: hypothetical protein AAFR79_05190 [Pseudomonadota bacterium]
MSPKRMEADWRRARAFADLPARRAKARDDRLFLEALHPVTAHTITSPALQEQFGRYGPVPFGRSESGSKNGLSKEMTDGRAATVLG